MEALNEKGKHKFTGGWIISSEETCEQNTQAFTNKFYTKLNKTSFVNSYHSVYGSMNLLYSLCKRPWFYGPF